MGGDLVEGNGVNHSERRMRRRRARRYDFFLDLGLDGCARGLGWLRLLEPLAFQENGLRQHGGQTGGDLAPTTRNGRRCHEFRVVRPSCVEQEQGMVRSSSIHALTTGGGGQA